MTSILPDDLEPADADLNIREQLLDAAARVFAQKGYAGTKIGDIVREADLSTGAIYGRFQSKNDLLRSAIIERSGNVAGLGVSDTTRVADIITRLAQDSFGPLRNDEAVRLEAYVAARRDVEVARAIEEATTTWRSMVQPLVDAALKDGSVSPEVDPDAVVYLIRTIGLGLLLQRAAGATAPEPEAWKVLITKVIASFGSQEKEGKQP